MQISEQESKPAKANPNPWTKSEDDILRKNYKAMTGKNLAALFVDRSRHSVIGRAYRLGLTESNRSRGAAVHPKIIPRGVTKKRKAPSFGVMKWQGGANPRPGSAAHKGPVFQRKITSKPLLDLEDGDCRWPEGRGYFCGRKAKRKKSYCSEHHAIATVEPRSKK